MLVMEKSNAAVDYNFSGGISLLRPRIDPIVSMWQRVEEIHKESKELDSKAEKLLKAACKKMKFDYDIIYDHLLVCEFPDYSNLRDCGVATEKPVKAYNEGDIKRAITTARARASYYGKSEMQEVEKLGKQWLAQFKKMKTKIDAIKDKSGFTELDKKACDLYNEALSLTEKILEIKATSVQGVLIQMQAMMHAPITESGEGYLTQTWKRISFIVDGIENLQTN